MTRLTTFLIKELPDELINGISEQIARYSVSLIEYRTDSAQSMGSAVLAYVGDTYGLITAAHVVKPVMDLEMLGIVLNAGAHRYEIPTKHLTSIVSSLDLSSDSGPDLGFLKLPGYAVGRVKAHNVFVSLARHREKKFALSNSKGVWVVHGSPEANVRVERNDRATTLLGKAMSYVTAPPDECSMIGDFDYLRFRAEYTDSNNLPETFQGVSGSGVWQLNVERRNEKFEILDVCLAGIAFRETKRTENSRELLCHGPHSLFDWLYSQLDS